MLSEQGYNDLAKQLKISADALKDAITKESEVGFEELGSPVKFVYTESEQVNLVANAKGKGEEEGYGKGKLAGEEKPFKDYKREHSPNSTAKNFPELISELEETNKQVHKQLLEEQKKDLTGNVDERIENERKLKEEALQKVTALQKSMTAQKEIYENEKRTWEQNVLKQKNDSAVLNAISAMDFDVPKEIEMKGENAVLKFVETQRNNAFILFNATHQTEYKEDGTPIYLRNGERLEDDTLSPRKISDIIIPFAKDNNFNLRKDETFGRGGDDSKQVFTGIKKGMTVEQFENLAKEKNLRKGTREFDLEWGKYRELNP